MSTKYWIGGDSGNEGDFNTAANWEGGSVPIAGDDIVFDGRAGINPDDEDAGQVIGNHWSVTSGLDRDVNFSSITVADDFTGNIGYTNSGTDYYLECTADSVTIAGSGTYYLKVDGEDDFDNIIVYDPAVLYISSDTTETCGTLTVFGGEVTSTVDTTTLTVINGLVVISGEVGIINCIDGTLYFTGDVTTKLTVISGDCYAGLLSTSSDTVSDIASAEINGGTFRWRTSGRITALTINGGSVTTTGAATKYLGHASNTTEIVLNAGTLDLSSGSEVILGTSTHIKATGSLLVPKGSEVSW